MPAIADEGGVGMEGIGDEATGAVGGGGEQSGVEGKRPLSTVQIKDD